MARAPELQFPWRSGCARRHSDDLGRGVPRVKLKLSWVEIVLTFHSRVLPMRATLVAAIAAALGLFALANLSPGPRADVARDPQLRAPIVAAAVSILSLSRAPML